MALQIAGQTAHFIVRYDDSITTPALSVAHAVLAICEIDLFKLGMYMPTTAGDPFIPPHPTIDVQIVNDLLKGPAFASAFNTGFSPGTQSIIRINPFAGPGVAISNDYAGFVFVAEMAEILMNFYGWDEASSQGEALSRVMAEVLHPASTSNFVNGWLQWPRPRPDWINHNELGSVGLQPRGDLDPIAYGCGIIFIYFLRYQLGFTYDKICGAGGVTLADRYRLLTGATDDPAVRVNSLLDKHFGTGAVNLIGNNPFPLFEGSDRKVFLAFEKISAVPTLLLATGTAHIKPFFTCPAADYPYNEQGYTIKQTITATTVGIGFPVYTWHINGQELFFGNQSGFSVTAQVNIPDPKNPGQHTEATQTFVFDYSIVTLFAATGVSSSLTLTSNSLHGDYSIDVQADADEAAVPSTPVSVKQALIMSTLRVEYGGNYNTDQQRCRKEFEKRIAGKVHGMQKSIDILRTLPDPPQSGYLTQVMRAVVNIQQELGHLAESDLVLATQTAQYVAEGAKLPPHVFLKGAGQ